MWYESSCSGTVITIGASSGKGKLNGISGLAVDHKGQVIVSDAADNRVVVFKKTGEYVTEIEYVGYDWEPSVGIATFEDKVYVLLQGELSYQNSYDIYEAVGSASREGRSADSPRRAQRPAPHATTDGRSPARRAARSRSRGASNRP